MTYSRQTSPCLLPLLLIPIFYLTSVPLTFTFKFFLGGLPHPYRTWVPEPWLWSYKEWRIHILIQEIWDWVISTLWWISHIPTLLISHLITPPPKAQRIYYIQMNKEVRLLNTDKPEGSVIIYSWTRKTNLTNLSRHSLCRGGIFSYWEHFLHTLSAFALRPKESLLQTLRLIKESFATLGGQGMEVLDVIVLVFSFTKDVTHSLRWVVCM